MYYITTKSSPRHYQVSIEQMLYSSDKPIGEIDGFCNDTRTISVGKIPFEQYRKVPCAKLLNALETFNEETEPLRAQPRESLYDSFKIPKSSGGLRQIDAPKPPLMQALKNLKAVFENEFGVLYHTSAHAYIKGRSAITCMKRHQANESRWFEKLDLHNFFGSTTPEFVERMFSQIYPFCVFFETGGAREEFRKAIDLCFLKGGLPQGTPISPLITNVMMIPIDYTIAERLRSYNNQRFVYTRYADDFQISSKYDFNFREIKDEIKNILKSFDAPFEINEKKTRYGSSAGSNWNLGIMLNKDNEMTIGHKKKRQFEAMLSSYAMDKRNHMVWSYADIQTMFGYYSYYKMIEGETIDRIVNHLSQKFEMDILKEIRLDIKSAS